MHLKLILPVGLRFTCETIKPVVPVSAKPSRMYSTTTAPAAHLMWLLKLLILFVLSNA